MTSKTCKIIFATRSGGSEKLANDLKQHLEASTTTTNCTLTISPIDEWFNDDNDESIGELLLKNSENENTVFVFILTTAENGSAPDMASDFYDALQDWSEEEETDDETEDDEDGEDENKTKKFQFTVFGNGDSRYGSTYQKFSRRVRRILTGKGGSVIAECREGDVSNPVEFDTVFNAWASDLAQKLKEKWI